MSLTTAYTSPLGTVIIESDGKLLTGLRFVDKQIEISGADKPLEEHTTVITDTLFAEAEQWLDDYFSGKQPCNVPAMNLHGTDFQHRVWQALLTVPYGQTKTYGEIARMVGCRSARAVGQAIGRNPIALIIPCHRVIGADGSITGYAYGTDRKKRLLDFEKKTFA